jgi:hypothetical protein
MCCTTRKNTSGGQTAKRFAAFACLLCFAAAVLLSGAFILTHTEHGHEHESAGGDCSVCAHLHHAETLLKTFVTAVSDAPFTFIILFAAISLLFVASYYYWSPVELRIRLNC